MTKNKWNNQLTHSNNYFATNRHSNPIANNDNEFPELAKQLRNNWHANKWQPQLIHNEFAKQSKTIGKHSTHEWQTTTINSLMTWQFTKTSQSNRQTGSARTTSNDQLINNEFARAIHNYLTYEQQTITINSQRIEQPIDTQ